MQPQYHLLRSFITRNNIARSQRASQFLLCTIAETKIQGFSLFSESTILCFNSVSQFLSLSYSVYLFENLEECFLNVVELKPLVFQRRINNRFIVLEHWQSTNLNKFCKKTLSIKRTLYGLVLGEYCVFRRSGQNNSWAHRSKEWLGSTHW